jgi:hypothetical protein
LASGYSLLLDAKQIRQGERIFRIPGLQRDPQQISFPLLVGLHWKKRKKRELARVRVCMAEFKFVFEFV